jgi:hypothetical protein
MIGEKAISFPQNTAELRRSGAIRADIKKHERQMLVVEYFLHAAKDGGLGRHIEFVAVLQRLLARFMGEYGNRAMSACGCLSLYGVARSWIFYEIFRRIFRYSSGDGIPSRVARPASAGPGSRKPSTLARSRPSGFDPSPGNGPLPPAFGQRPGPFCSFHCVPQGRAFYF